MSVKSIARCVLSLPSHTDVFSGKVKVVDYSAIFTEVVAAGRAKPEERDEHVRAMMNVFITELTVALVEMYKAGEASGNREAFDVAFPNYVELVLNPVYDSAPETCIIMIRMLNRIPRKLRDALDARSDLMIARINIGGSYAVEDGVNPYTKYLQNHPRGN